MERGLLPKKFEIQFRLTAEDQYTGVLLVEGMQMGVGTPKTLEEITAFLMPSVDIRLPKLDQVRT